MDHLGYILLLIGWGLSFLYFLLNAPVRSNMKIFCITFDQEKVLTNIFLNFNFFFFSFFRSLTSGLKISTALYKYKAAKTVKTRPRSFSNRVQVLPSDASFLLISGWKSLPRFYFCFRGALDTIQPPGKLYMLTHANYFIYLPSGR